MKSSTPESRFVFSLKLGALNALLALIMSGSVLGVYLLMTAKGAIFSGEEWLRPLIKGVGLTRRALVIGGGMGLIWACIWGSNRFINFSTGVLCTGIYEMFTVLGVANPIAIILGICVCCALVYGIHAFYYSYHHELKTSSGTGSDTDALYQDANKLMLSSDYEAANRAFQQLLAHPKQFSKDRLRDIQINQAICLAKLGAEEEAKTKLKLTKEIEIRIWNIMISNFNRLKGLHEVKPEHYMHTYTDSEIKQEIVEEVLKNADNIKALDAVFDFDDIYAQGIYYYLAVQLFYMRKFKEAAALLANAFKKRKPRDLAKRISVKPVPVFALYDLLGDSLALSEDPEDRHKALLAYTNAIRLDPYAEHVKAKIKKLEQERTFR